MRRITFRRGGKQVQPRNVFTEMFRMAQHTSNVLHVEPRLRSAKLASSEAATTPECVAGGEWHAKCRRACGCICHALTLRELRDEQTQRTIDQLTDCKVCGLRHNWEHIEAGEATVDPDEAMFGYDLSHLYPEEESWDTAEGPSDGGGSFV